MSDPLSALLLQRAEKLMPAGVNSPVRAFRAVGGQAVFIKKAQGSKVYGADGREYIDYIGAFGAALLGHAHPTVVQAVQASAQRGFSFGAPTELEVEFAEAIVQRYPSIEMLRCVSSGTEAGMSALRLARGFTGRDLIVKFDGGYHGHADSLLVKAGSGLATFGTPDSAGVPSAVAAHTLVLDYNDTAKLTELFRERGHEIACVIVEPVAGNMGCVPPAPGFLEAIVSLCREYGAVSIFDEVMTGCRVSRGGAQEFYKLTPDLTCLGKVVGGGMPLAVYGGRADIMRLIAPLGPVYQAGTLSGNPLSVSAGLATLAELGDAVYQKLEEYGAKLEAGLLAAIRETQRRAVVQRVGAMLTLFFSDRKVTSWQDATGCDRDAFARFHAGLLTRGIYWPPSQFEAAFFSAAHDELDLRTTLDAARESLAQA